MHVCLSMIELKRIRIDSALSVFLLLFTPFNVL